MEALTIKNLMKTDNQILHRILQLLDFYSLESFSLAIADTYLWNSLNISFDLERKLKPWTHNKCQDPLRSYWMYKSFDINHSNLIYDICRCKYCLKFICCKIHWYNVNYKVYKHQGCTQCTPMEILHRVRSLTSFAQRVITDRLKYRLRYKHPYTRSEKKRKEQNNGKGTIKRIKKTTRDYNTIEDI